MELKPVTSRVFTWSSQGSQSQQQKWFNNEDDVAKLESYEAMMLEESQLQNKEELRMFLSKFFLISNNRRIEFLY